MIVTHLNTSEKIEPSIKEKYYWKNMDKDIMDYIRICKIYQTQKLTRIRPTEIPTMIDTPTEPNDKIAMDIFGPLRKTRKENKYILSIQDVLAKYLAKYQY